jgi:hypothetical protein
MSKKEQFKIARFCKMQLDHELVRKLWDDPEILENFMTSDDGKLSKDALFEITATGLSFFRYDEVWDSLPKLAKQYEAQGTPLTVQDITDKRINEKSLLDLALTEKKLDKLFTPDLWKGQMKEMENLWFSISWNDRLSQNFLETRRLVAKASGKTLREDELRDMGINLTEFRRWLKEGKLDLVKNALAKSGDHLRKDDVLLLDEKGDTIFESITAWHNLEEMHKELVKNGEPLCADDFMFKRGVRSTPLEKAIDHNQLHELFCPKIWVGRLDEMEMLWNEVPYNHQEKARISQKFDIQKAMLDTENMTYDQDGVADDMNTVESLTTPLNKNKENPVLPLSLKAVWDKIDMVEAAIGQNNQKLNIENLREKSGYNGMSIMQIAAQYGHFEKVLEIIKDDHLTVQDLIEQNKAGQTLISILAEKKQLDAVFNAEMWVGRVHDMMTVWENVPVTAQHEHDIQVTMQVANYLTLKSLRPLPQFAPK